MIDLDDADVRNDVLGKVYSSAISEMHEFRTTMGTLLTGFVTIMLLFLGWALSTQMPIDLTRQVLISVGILIVTVVGLYLTRIFERYFLDIAGVIARIDQAHGAFEEGRYLPGRALYPDHWKRFGSPNWKEPIFRMSYAALLVMGSFSIVVVFVAL